MDCEKVRDRFSSWWEKELPSFEEKILKEHLSSCPACRREFEQFEKTMRWLHSVGEVDVPEGFLPELYKKREGKKGAAPSEKPGGKWFHLPLSVKLPVQAVAMVAVVFLVLYLTKMMPMEGGRLRETKQTSSPVSMQEKPEQAMTPSAVPPPPEPLDRVKAPSPVEELESKANHVSEGEKRRSRSTLSELPASDRQAHPLEQRRGTGRGVEGLAQQEGKGSEQAPPPAPGGIYAPETPPPKAGVMAYQAMESRGTGREKEPPPEPGKIKKEFAAQEKSLVASKPPQEIILKISDRKKVIPRLHELVEQFGGEVVATESDRFVASVPTASFPEFEKELEGFSSSVKADRWIAKKDAAESMKIEGRAKREEGDEKRKGLAKLAAGTESRTIVRIHLVEE